MKPKILSFKDISEKKSKKKYGHRLGMSCGDNPDGAKEMLRMLAKERCIHNYDFMEQRNDHGKLIGIQLREIL